MEQNNGAVIKLACFPFAGAGASFYNDWADFFDRSVEVLPIQLPGREREIAEEPYRNIHVAADRFADIIEEEIDHSPIALFGHCFMGAALAYEVARRLESRGKVPVARLFVSAASSPISKRDYAMSSYRDDETFIEEVEKLTGYMHPAFTIPDLRELLVPTLRADFEMDESYVPSANGRIHAPITAMFASDDSFVAQEDVALWRQFTSGDFELLPVQGEHMYITNTSEQAKAIIKHSLASIPKEGALYHE